MGALLTPVTTTVELVTLETVNEKLSQAKFAGDMYITVADFPATQGFVPETVKVTVWFGAVPVTAMFVIGDAVVRVLRPVKSTVTMSFATPRDVMVAVPDPDPPGTASYANPIVEPSG